MNSWSLCGFCRLLVGAPKANNTAVPQLANPGVVYKCDFSKDPQCLEVAFDTKGKFTLIMHFGIVLRTYFNFKQVRQNYFKTVAFTDEFLHRSHGVVAVATNEAFVHVYNVLNSIRKWGGVPNVLTIHNLENRVYCNISATSLK